jgi:hypothetical protein
MRNTPGGKHIAVWSQYISSLSAVNLLVAFYDIYGGKGEVLFFCSGSDTHEEWTFHVHLIILQKKR